MRPSSGTVNEGITVSAQGFTTPPKRFDADKYDEIGPEDSDGVLKLRESSVAPLVAAARGYEMLDKEGIKEHVKDVHGQERSKGNALKSKIGDSALFIPLYPIDAVHDRKVFAPERRPRKRSRQYRPSNPIRDKDGRLRKYHIDAGQPSYIDVHPSTPREWIENPETVLITEGIIKGDSALTAMLRDSGVIESKKEYELLSDDNPDNALHDLMLEVPQNKRVLILSLVGVQNFKQNPEWYPISLSDSSVWLAFDGDSASNLQVWKAANDMLTFLAESKHVAPDRLHFVDLSPVETNDGEKVGIDDFLSDHGTWKDIAGLLTDELPPMPPKTIDDEEIGTTRMTEDGTALVRIEADEVNGGRIEAPLVGLGGRIKHTLSGRTPTSAETNDWVYDETVARSLVHREVAIEVIWRDGSEDGTVHPLDKSADIKTGYIVGPVEMLNYPPDRWATTFRKDMHIDLEVLRHQAWPPSGKSGIGEEWLSALKKNRYRDQLTVDKWTTMGWVPVKGREGRPQFVLGGEQIIGEMGADDSTETSISGVDEGVVKDASKFHLDVPKAKVGTDEYNAIVKDAIERVMDVFVDDTPWIDSRIGAMIFASALRPVIPTKTNSVLYFVGAPKSGKALPLDQEIPVPYSTSPTGVKMVRDFAVGDEVFAGDGSHTTVRRLSEVHTDQLYEVKLTDGRTTEVSSAHLLSVSTSRSRSLAARQAAANALDGTDQVIHGLRQAAKSLSSGYAAELGDICAKYGLSMTLLARALDAAAVPSMRLIAPDADDRPQTREVYLVGSLPELEAVDGGALVKSATITADELETFFGITNVSSPTHTLPHADLYETKVFPVGESMLALADLLTCGADTGVSLHRNVTARALSSMMDQAPMLDASPAVRGGIGGQRDMPVPRASVGARSAGADFAASLALSEESVSLPPELITAHLPYRREWISGFIDAAEDAGLTNRDDRRCVIEGLSDPALRSGLADLVRSTGMTAIAFATGSLAVVSDQANEWSVIESVRPTGRDADVRCLSVSHHSGVFLCESYIPTHNSWTAAQLMQFWSDKASWDHESLPGSAEDTPSATEIAISKTPLWVVDDLAPSADSRKADVDQSRVATLVRSVRNSAPKQRANAEMRIRESLTPKALTVITAENELVIQSAMNRVMTLTFKSGSMVDERLDKMVKMNETPYPSRVTAALIQLIASRDYQREYEDPADPKSASAFWRGYRKYLEKDVHEIMRTELGGNDLKRQAEITADLMLPINPLRMLAERVGVDKKYLKMLDTFSKDSIGDKIVSLSKESFSVTGAAKPGEALISALRQALASGKCHVRPMTGSGEKPFTSGQVGQADVARINEDLGWETSGPAPKGMGTAIGRSLVHKGRPYILFDQANAFDVAQKYYPSQVPHGQKSRSSWESVWTEGLADAITSRRKSGREPTCAVMRDGVRTVGIPVPLASLMQSDDVAEFDLAEEVLNEDLS